MTKEYIEQIKVLRGYITLMDSETLELVKQLIAEELTARTARRLLKKVREW